MPYKKKRFPIDRFTEDSFKRVMATPEEKRTACNKFITFLDSGFGFSHLEGMSSLSTNIIIKTFVVFSGVKRISQRFLNPDDCYLSLQSLVSEDNCRYFNNADVASVIAEHIRDSGLLEKVKIEAEDYTIERDLATLRDLLAKYPALGVETNNLREVYKSKENYVKHRS